MLSDIHAIWLREIKRTLRARSRVITSLALPFFWLVFIGIGFGSSVQIEDVQYINFLAPGIIGMILLFTSVFSGLSIIIDRQFGFLKEILVAPISRTSTMLGKTLGGTTVAMISALIMLVIALATGLVPLGFGVLLSLVFMFLTAFCFVSIGLIIASRMKSMEGFQTILSFLIMPLFFLSGALFPLRNTPEWMQTAAMADPLSYGVDGLRGTLIGISMNSIWLDFAALFVFSMAFILLGAHFFRKSTINWIL